MTAAEERAREDQTHIFQLEECLALYADGLSALYGVRFQSALTHLLVLLNDSLQYLSKSGRRVTANDFLAAEVTSITDHVANCRNAAVHQTSARHKIGSGIFRRNVVVGLQPNAFVLNGTPYGCAFADDAAVFFGSTQFYLGRHGLAAIDGAVGALGFRRDEDGRLQRRDM